MTQKFNERRFQCDQLVSVKHSIKTLEETIARLRKMEKELEEKIKK